MTDSPRNSWGRPFPIATALVVAILFLLSRCEPETPPPTAPADDPGVAEQAPPLEPPTSQTSRTIEADYVSVAEVDDPAVVVQAPFAFAIRVSITDTFGLPVDGARLFVAPPGCGFTMWPTGTDGGGRVELQWRGKKLRMEVTVAVLAWGVLQPLRRLSLVAAEPATLAIVAQGQRQDLERREELRERGRLERMAEDTAREMDRGRHRPGRMQRRDALDVTCGRSELLFREFACTNCHDDSKVAPYAALQFAAEAVPGLHPFALFGDHAPRVPDAKEQAERRRQLEPREPPSRMNQMARQHKQARERGAGGTAMVTGRVTDAQGLPAGRVPVAWMAEDGAVLLRTATNDSGAYRLGPVGTGPILLRAGGGSAGIAESAMAAVSRTHNDWSPSLAQANTLRGRAADDQGNPLIGWRVEFEGDAVPWADLETTGADGSFEITHLPGRGRFLLWSAETDLRLPVLASDLVLPESAPVMLQLQEALPTRARLRLRPFLPHGFDRVPVDVRFFQMDTGRGAHATQLMKDDMFGLEGLSSGVYRVEVGAPGLGWVTLEAIITDGRGLYDLGVVVLSAPGRVALQARPGQESPLALDHAFYRRDETVDVRVIPQRNENVLTLPRGEYLLMWRTGSGDRSVTFRVETGRDTVLTLP